MHVVVTGGAGFIGSHLADELFDYGYTVRVLDNLDPQVHRTRQRPAYLRPGVELVVGDVRDLACVRRCLRGADAVVHLAAKVGVGQSMYEIGTYSSVNEVGTATLLQAMIGLPVRKLLVASSMSIYGEGLMSDERGRPVETIERTADDLRRGEWDPKDAAGRFLRPLPTPEDKRPILNSVYALGKFAQERMCLITGRAYGIETTALRFFNVYGPRQALSNPYTGVIAIFAARLLNSQPPLVFEDGEQRRDFVHVRDVARACRLALETGKGTGQAINIGSGNSISIIEIAEKLIEALRLGHEVRPQITGQFRVGDIRHCFADVGRARRVLGFEAKVRFDEGLRELVEWLSGEPAVDLTSMALNELASRGLVA
ncbi:MAG: NAD-dependent epimerase/dehydratase family protein [Bacteroidota bacterium]